MTTSYGSGEATPREVRNEANVMDGLVKPETNFYRCIFIISGISLSITVDILQYSMPLSFLPSVLEDRGHSTIRIASAIGIYYWTGFLGGAMITAYQIWRLLKGSATQDTVAVTASSVKRHILFLVFGLLAGTVTLCCQALYPHYTMHICCRFIQGGAGAFIFFYAFLLSVNLFEPGSDQQNYAMTAAGIALNVAEVFGSLIGAVVFKFWGQRCVFWTLGITSVVNQLVLLRIYFLVKSVEGPPPAFPPKVADEQTSLVANGQKLFRLCTNRRLIIAVMLIFVSAIVKGSVEEMLPFHADHQWDMGPLHIGKLFAITAAAYIGSAFFVGKSWRGMAPYRVLFSAASMAALGVFSPLLFTTSLYTENEIFLYCMLVAYGTFLGFTYTPSTLLIADAIDHEEGVARDAMNGIWNTMWEAGGSLGFLLGGYLANNHSGQIRLMFGNSVICVCCSACVLVISQQSFQGEEKGKLTHISSSGV
eukprot:TRINITY_DN7715_c0_g1_i4.p1 TRINITY_DN7715_c0_g1~~TRINITY_DN7715_c0_g1_i4.p1  ORF type:complete len:478 (+),score=57.09 TRINITY_DN7715_c0_g1_i4:66-1499(+)